MMLFLYSSLFVVGLLGGVIGVSVSAAFDGQAKQPSVRNFIISQLIAILFFALALSNLKFGLWPYILSEFASLCAYFVYFYYIVRFQKQ